MNTRNLFVSALVIAAASTAMADVVQMQFVGTGSGRSVRITSGSGTQSVFAGQLVHNFSGGTGSLSSFTGDHFTFCVDLGQYVTNNPRTYTLTPVDQLTSANPMGAARAQALNDIFTAQPFWPTQASVSNDYAAALQLVIWDVITDYNSSSGLSSLGLSNGTFRATNTNGSALGSALMAHYNTFVSYIGSSSGSGSALLGFGNSSCQDQITPGSIPAPASGLLAGMGALVMARRRR